MFYLLTVCYAVLMGFAAAAQRGKLGLPLVFLNLFFSVALLFSPIHMVIAAAGFLGLIGCAVWNGYALHGRVHALHLLIRCAISFGLFWGLLGGF